MNRLPTRDELVAFIRERSGKVGTREIARAFGAKNADRAALNRMLREIADQGLVDRRRKRLHHAGTLPPVVLADVTGRDSDGELLARPTEWDEEAHGAPPVIHIATPRRARPGEVPGVGDRALIRIEQTSDGETSWARHQADRSRQEPHARNFSRPARRRRPAGADRQEAAWPRTEHPAKRHRGRGRRRSCRGRSSAARPVRACRRHRRRAAWLAQERARGQPDRHPCPRYSAHIFRRRARGSRRRACGLACRPRRLAPRSFRHHRSAGRQGSRRRGACDTRSRPEESGRPYRQRRHRRRRALCAAGFGARPRGGQTRQLGLFSRPRRADAAGAYFQRSVLAAADTKIGRRSRCAWLSAPTAASARTRSTAC